MTISLALWKPTLKNWRAYWWLLPVGIRTGGLIGKGWYGHCELVIDYDPASKKNTCYSATISEGVRIKARDLTQGDWDVIKLTLNEWQVDYILEEAQLASTHYANHQPFTHYNTTAIIGYLFAQHGVTAVNDMFCSQADYVALRYAGYFTGGLPGPIHPWAVSPNKLAELVRAREAELKGVPPLRPSEQRAA